MGKETPGSRRAMNQSTPGNPRRNYSRWRAASLIAVHLLIAAHIAHWLVSGRTLAPLEFNEVLHTLHLGIITAGFLFMALTVVGTLIAGRFFCSWACHILALQDLSAWLLGKLRIRPQPIRSRTLLWAPTLAVLYLFVWPQVARVAAGHGLQPLRVQTDGDGWGSFATNDFWRNLPGPGITLLTFAVVGGLTVYLLGTRGFCRYACPYGAIFGLADRLAPGRIKLVGDCSQCGLCTANCQSQILVHKEVARFGKVVDSRCLKDLDCVAVCPNQALAYGFTKPSFGRSLNDEERSGQPYSFTVREDLFIAALALGLVVVYRGLYDAIPFLLSVALAILLATLSVKTAHLWRRPTVRLNNVLLKQDGRWRTPGRWLAAVTLLLAVFSVHSGFIHYQTATGRQALRRALDSNPAVDVHSPSAASVTSRGELPDARTRLLRADRFGLWTSRQLGHDLATVHLLNNEPEAAQAQLKRIVRKNPADFAASLRLARLALAQRRGPDLDSLLHPILTAKESRFSPADFAMRSEALVLAGQAAELRNDIPAALGYHEAATRDNPRNGEAHLALGTLLARGGRLTEAEQHLQHAATTYRDRAIVLENLAIVNLKLGRSSEAIAQFQELLAAHPEQAQTHYHLGVALYQAGEPAMAARAFQRTLELRPDHSAARESLRLIEETTTPAATHQ